jgi:hypothetical protein
MSRSLRATYPEQVRYITRFKAGSIQKRTGLPASLVTRIKRGEVKRLSPGTIEKLTRLYNSYWSNRMEKGGINPDERFSILKTRESPKYMRERIFENREIAREITENRRERDRDKVNKRGFAYKFPAIADTLRQMAIDTTRTSQEWAWIAEHGSA